MIIESSQKLRKIDTSTVPLSRFQVNENETYLVKETKYLGLMNEERALLSV